MSRSGEDKRNLKKPAKKKEKSLWQRYKEGNPKVGLFGDPSGKFDFVVYYDGPEDFSQPPVPIQATGWEDESDGLQLDSQPKVAPQEIVKKRARKIPSNPPVGKWEKVRAPGQASDRTIKRRDQRMKSRQKNFERGYSRQSVSSSKKKSWVWRRIDSGTERSDMEKSSALSYQGGDVSQDSMTGKGLQAESQTMDFGQFTVVLPSKQEGKDYLQLEDGENRVRRGGSKMPKESNHPMKIGMVNARLPCEFRISSTIEEDSDHISEQEIAMAEFQFHEEAIKFKRVPDDKAKHLRSLLISGKVDGRPIGGIFVDAGATLNLMSYKHFKKMGRRDDEITPSNVQLSDFLGEVTDVKGAVIVDLTIGSKTSKTTFFVIESDGTYNLLLGRDWIHANQCVPSTLHQTLAFWNKDKVEYVKAEGKAVPIGWTEIIQGNEDYLGGNRIVELPGADSRFYAFCRFDKGRNEWIPRSSMAKQDVRDLYGKQYIITRN